MYLAREMEEKGYFTHIFRFMYDLRSDDYSEISKSQSDISYSDAANSKNLFLHYDFRDVWERVFFRRIGEKLRNEGHTNSFVDLVAPTGSKFKNIFDGISKSLSIKISVPMGPALVSAGLDLECDATNDTIPLKTFNRISRELFQRECTPYQMYFFIDELVFSRLDAKDDEVTLRAAMVRDILRCAWELNSFCVQNDLKFHFVCSIRPEIRSLIGDYDSEAGKFLDGKDVELSWITTDGKEGQLIKEVFKRKVEHSFRSKIDFDKFVTPNISFGSKTDTLEEFLLTNTWGRPRDVVRLLNSIQKKSPNAATMDEDSIKASLDDYSRASSKELIDELGVSYGPKILQALRLGINRKTFSTKQHLKDALAPTLGDKTTNALIDEFFQLGLIGGYNHQNGHYFWAHRGENFLKGHHQIRIHHALWNDFSIRDR